MTPTVPESRKRSSSDGQRIHILLCIFHGQLCFVFHLAIFVAQVLFLGPLKVQIQIRGSIVLSSIQSLPPHSPKLNQTRSEGHAALCSTVWETRTSHCYHLHLLTVPVRDGK